MHVGVVGAGAMGSGIARVAAVAGHEVLLHDARDGAARAAIERIEASLDRSVAKGRLTSQDASETLGRLRVADSLTALTPCGLVVEAIVEDLEIKQRLIDDLEAVVDVECMLATNTSSLAVGAVFRRLRYPHRAVGLHFFNPAHVMRLVEVIPGPSTSEETLAAAQGFVQTLGKSPVVSVDSPGFIVNFAGRALNTEALAVAAEGVATVEQVDRIIRQGCGFRMGPFELMDLTGMDVNYPVTQNIFEHNSAEPLLRTTWYHRYLYEVGLHGQKTGRGFYGYPRPADAEEVFESPDTECRVALPGGLLLAEREEFCHRHGLTVIEDDGRCPLLLAPLGRDCTEAARREGVDPNRSIGVDLALGVPELVTLMAPPGVDREAVEQVQRRIASADSPVELINDSPGFVAQRIIATIVNLGAEMAQRGIASPPDIDYAVELGLGYPHGPLALAERYGPNRIVEILEGMYETTHDPRYRVNRWLRRRAAAGIPIHTPDLVPVSGRRGGGE